MKNRISHFGITFLSVFINFWSVVLMAEPASMQTVDRVELKSYLGLWYEYTRIPNSFQDFLSEDGFGKDKEGFGRCIDTTAEYNLREDGKITVVNTCTRKNDQGQSKPSVAKAIAWVVNDKTNAELKVNFVPYAVLRAFGVGDGDYFILGLGPLNADGYYTWAVVGEPKRKYGWILSREKKMSKEDLDSAYKILEEQGYSRSQFMQNQNN